ncbi:hypothetical protein K438DRAFT_1786461 [Mycena galopus ATCC 62051]|nr:hypothetical protein K438DRAFT_1786461 [Mycena galopus ATCC 62051]
MKTSPELFIRSPLPPGSWLIGSQGLNGRQYLLSLAVYHPGVADHSTPDIEFADMGLPPPAAHTSALSTTPVLYWEGVGRDDGYSYWSAPTDRSHSSRPQTYLSSLCCSEVGTGKEFERQEVGPGEEFESTVNVDNVKIPVNVQTEVLAADEHTTKIADVSAETDSDEQAKQKVTEILNLWKRWEETETLLRGVSDHRIFVLKRCYRFYLQGHMQDYM